MFIWYFLNFVFGSTHPFCCFAPPGSRRAQESTTGPLPIFRAFLWCRICILYKDSLFCKFLVVALMFCPRLRFELLECIYTYDDSWLYIYTCLAGENILVLSQLQGKLCRFFGRSQPCYFIMFCIEGQIGHLCPTFARCRTRTGSDSDSKVKFGSGPVIVILNC